MKIPVKTLKEFAQKYDLSHIIVFAHDRDGTTDHIATYGRTVGQCAQAASFGSDLKDALGWPESLQVQPPRVQQLQTMRNDMAKTDPALADQLIATTRCLLSELEPEDR